MLYPDHVRSAYVNIPDRANGLGSNKTTTCKKDPPDTHPDTCQATSPRLVTPCSSLSTQSWFGQVASLPGTPRATLATYVTEDGIDVATPTQNQDLHR